MSARPEDTVVRIAEAVAAAWSSCSSGGTNLELPVGTVAALALIRQDNPDGPDPALELDQITHQEFGALLRDIWNLFALLRPDLSPVIGPVRDWVYDDRGHQLADMHAVARAATRAGLFNLIAAHRHNVDLFATLLMTMRPKSALNGRGQFYTPNDVARMIAHATIDPDVRSINEPAAGTGNMLRAAAEVIRARGGNPARCLWVANDIDALAVACMAVNVHLWDLGRNVLLGCADTLTDPDWTTTAAANRAAAIEEVDSLLRTGRAMQAMRNLFSDERATVPVQRGEAIKVTQ